MPYPIKNYQIETRDFSEMNHTKISGYIIVNIVPLSTKCGGYINLKNYFKLQLLEFLLLGGQSIIGLGCLLFLLCIS